jgi:4-amino-4-deoxy-L-arabinose transferase-like glycosyltransferase
MSTSTDATPQTAVRLRRAWRLEPEVLFLVALVFAAYFTRAGVLPLRGEEPTRAQIAFEMVQRGDWLVPREQGDPFRIRPPLQNWLIAGSCLAFGDWGPYAVRFPSLLATLAVTLLVYGYSRTFLTRLGALAAGIAYATFGEMFQTGRQAETEALFILLVSASQFTWHWGMLRPGASTAAWVSGYTFAALGFLTKGMQAPVYFVGPVVVYLVVMGEWRRLFSWAHVLGLSIAVALVACWAVPYALVMGWSALGRVWFGDPALRLGGHTPFEIVSHLVVYPLETLGATLPWSPWLLLFLNRAFRRRVSRGRPQVVFVALCLAIAFPTCWIPPGGQARFFAPLYPALAILIGCAIESCSLPSKSWWVGQAWNRFSSTAAVCMVAFAALVVGVSIGGDRLTDAAGWAEPLVVALPYGVVAVALAMVVYRVRAGGSAANVRLGLLALGCFLVVTFTGVVTDVRWRRSTDAAAEMRELKSKLPPGQALVSLGGHTDSLFGYLYGLPLITPRPWPPGHGDPGPDVPYFCIVCPGDSRPPMDFAWEEIGVVSLDRNRHPQPERVVVVGRRLPPSH